MLTTTTEILPSVANQMQASIDFPGTDRPYDLTAYNLGFDVQSVAPCIVEAHTETQLFINDIIHKQTARRRWLTLYGCSGAGKTHLATAAAQVIRDNGRRVQKWRWGRALGLMMEGEWQLMRQLQDMPVLVLDDIGAEYLGADRSRRLNAAKLLELLEARLDRWTILTTNLTPRQLGEELDPRISSRLYRGQNMLVNMGEHNDYALRAYRTRQERRKAQE